MIVIDVYLIVRNKSSWNDDRDLARLIRWRDVIWVVLDMCCVFTERLPCVDELSYCQEFGRDVCQQEQYGQYMRKNCRKFCDICKGNHGYILYIYGSLYIFSVWYLFSYNKDNTEVFVNSPSTFRRWGGMLFQQYVHLWHQLCKWLNYFYTDLIAGFAWYYLYV